MSADIRKVPPKVELFSDHLGITSFGRLPEGLSKDDFFAGVSIPRNKELMRIFRDLELVESQGSGMGYIMQKYGRDNFIRMTVPYITKDREGQAVATEQATVQAAPPTAQVEAQVEAQVARHILVLLAHEPLGSSKIALELGHKSLSGIVKTHLKTLLNNGLIELTQPDSPRSPTQKYRLTPRGMAALSAADAADGIITKNRRRL